MSGLPLNADDPFLPSLQVVINRNCPELKPSPDSLEDPIAHPITFHDRHLAPQLILKHVRIVPTLADSLADYCTHVLEEFSHNGYNFDHTTYTSFSYSSAAEPMKEAFSVARGYSDMFGAASVQLATKILLDPGVAEWTRLLVFIPGNLDIPSGREFFADGRLVVNRREPAPVHRDAEDLHSVYQWLASWSFYSLTHRARRAISLMSSMSHFNWETARTQGLPSAPSLPIPPDTPEGFATDRIAEYTAGRRKVSERKDPNNSWSKKRSIKIPRQRKSRTYAPPSKDYIQKGWSTAVIEDTTFLIFSCGSHERIGIRHRASQTLYLSGLIDTAHTNPTYGKIQLGLYSAIIRDSLNRMNVRKLFDKKHKLSLKRPLGGEFDIDEKMPVAKRRKTDAESVTMTLANLSQSTSEIEIEMSNRTVLLLNLRYGSYSSPSPSCFSRLGTSCVQGLFDDKYQPPSPRTTYDSGQYMTTTLRAPIGKGAIGTAHRGIVDLLTPSGKKLSQPCLVKLAFQIEARTALKHEFDMYQHLAKEGVFSGILKVHGLFEDLQTGTMALLMDYGGYSLRRREYELDNEFNQNYVVIAENERAVILRALEQIHNAGLCHNDVRIDNIVVNEYNKIAFIDFDHANVTTRPFAFQQELSELRSAIRIYASEESATNTSQDDESVRDI